jgi:hypothetical protein
MVDGPEEGSEPVQREDDGCHALGGEGVVVVEVEEGDDGHRQPEVDGQEEAQLLEAEVEGDQVARQVLLFALIKIIKM